MHLGGQVGQGGPRVYPPLRPRGLGASSLGNHSCSSSRDRDAGLVAEQEEMACGELGFPPSVHRPDLQPEGPGLLTQSPAPERPDQHGRLGSPGTSPAAWLSEGDPHASCTGAPSPASSSSPARPGVTSWWPVHRVVVLVRRRQERVDGAEGVRT